MYLRSLIIFGLLTAIKAIGDNSPSLSSRIHNGTSSEHAGVAAIMTEIPYMGVKVAFCSGFIITERWIGTAAKCVFYADRSSILVGVGSSSPQNAQTYEVMDFIIHDDFSNNTLSNDIALLQTAEAIIFSSTVAAIPIQSDFFDSAVGVDFYGFGKTAMILDARCEICTSLLHTEFTVLPLENCRMFFPIGIRNLIQETHICSRHAERATCLGDNGGPIVFNNRVVGVISWVDPCLAGQANVNTRISSYYDWIVERTGLIETTTTDGTSEDDSTTIEDDSTTIEDDSTTIEDDSTTIEDDSTTAEDDSTTAEEDWSLFWRALKLNAEHKSVIV